jgi:hypothetical protein
MPGRNGGGANLPTTMRRRSRAEAKSTIRALALHAAVFVGQCAADPGPLARSRTAREPRKLGIVAWRDLCKCTDGKRSAGDDAKGDGEEAKSVCGSAPRLQRCSTIRIASAKQPVTAPDRGRSGRAPAHRRLSPRRHRDDRRDLQPACLPASARHGGSHLDRRRLVKHPGRQTRYESEEDENACRVPIGPARPTPTLIVFSSPQLPPVPRRAAAGRFVPRARAGFPVRAAGARSRARERATARALRRRS